MSVQGTGSGLPRYRGHAAHRVECPSLKLGRRCVYDKLDLDAWLDEYKQREHWRAGKGKTLWPVKRSYRRPDSRFWWIATTLPNGKRLRQSAGTENREDAEALLAKLTLEAYGNGTSG